nr:helix-turn-helix transcriptional regulator [uncultured Desulfobulbus sp.]
MNKANTSKIKHLLKQYNTKQKDIAAFLGVSAQFVNQVINGKRSTGRVMQAIAFFTKRSVAELWLDEE